MGDKETGSCSAGPCESKGPCGKVKKKEPFMWGALVLISALLTLLASPAFVWLTVVLAGSLLYAGVTGMDCPMTKMIKQSCCGKGPCSDKKGACDDKKGSCGG